MSTQSSCVMGERSTAILTISDLIQRARPLTAASSLIPSRPISTLEVRKSSDQNNPRRTSFPQNPNSQTLKPLNQPTLVVGMVTLPSFTNRDSPIKCNCLQFSDDSASICCDILDFDPKIIDQKIRILSWNFIPFKCGNGGVKGGFLEIITWDFFHPCSGKVCSLSGFSCFCLSTCDVRDNSKARCLIFGVIDSISPVCVVPCASEELGSRSIYGFLVNVLVCECQCCASKYLVSELRDFSEEKVKDHCFIKSVIVYFCGLASSWHPVISRFIGDVVLLVGLKKKLVFLRKEESQLMYVTTDEVFLHIAKLFTRRGLNHNADIRGKGVSGSYTGVVTGFYMQGMALELDEDVILLLTDQHLTVPHCVRVGALVTLKNVHFVDPKFPWGKMLLLGACCRTSLHVESFSALESWCHLKSHSPSVLQKFIDSLSFAARLWALLVVSCFRKKFAGILSEKVILGSKHKEGLAQKYASSHLPLSAFQFRHGVLLEFCRHNLCSVGKEVDYGHLRLVLPIANLISYCEASWKRVLEDQENYSDFTGGINQIKPVWCSGRSYVQPIRRVLCSEEIGILVLGNLKISSSSGRVQLVDATGCMDIVLDLPATWDFDTIFEAKDFRLIIEGIHSELVDLDSTIYKPLSCRSIFSNALPLRRLKTSIYLYHCPRDEDSISHSLFFDRKGNSQDIDSGKYYLLMLTHKFPIQQKFLGDLSKRPNMFVEAIVLPWCLLVAGKYRDAVMTMVSSGHCKDTLENFARHEEHLTHKRCKTEQASVEVSSYCLNDAGNGISSHCSGFCSSQSSSYTENTSCVSNNQPELPFLVAGKSANFLWMGMLHCADEHTEIISGCKPPRRKVLLEFGPDSFCKYEALKIGHCYLVKHQEGHMPHYTRENYQVGCPKVFVTSGTHIRGLTFSSTECLQSADVADGYRDELIPEGYREYEIPCLIGNSMDNEIYSDLNIFVPSSALNLLENVIKTLVVVPDEPRDSFAVELGIHYHGGPMINASIQSSGTSCSDYPLPQGNLVTLRGFILAFHDCHGVAFPAQPGPIPGEHSLLLFVQEDAGACVHVFTDNHIVRVFCDLSKETYPIGLGRDVYATFHRILVLSERNKYMMTPISFITVDHTSLMSGNLTHDLNYASGTVGSHSVASPNTVHTALISDALQLSGLKPMQFHCRVVALYILVLEKAGTTAISQSCVQSIRSAFGVPLAGFIMDDGSASCCCWADRERAANFLGLDSEEYSLEDSPETSEGCKAGKRQPYGSTVSLLNQVLEQHGRITVKNYGSMFDSSCQDLTFSVNSDRSISSSDEDVLGRLITNALCNKSWTIVGSLVDPKATSSLEGRLTELDVGVPPLPNIWATSVCPTDMLAEARNIIQELI